MNTVIEVRSVVRCDSCYSFADNGDDDLGDYYDADDICSEVNEKSYWTAEQWSETNILYSVESVSMRRCPECDDLVAADEVVHYDAYVCPECGAYYLTDDYTSHDALMCCVTCDKTAEDGCLDGCREHAVSNPAQLVLACYCSGGCPYYVCRYCHWIASEHDDVERHIAALHPTGELADEETEEPAPQPVVPDCEMCASEWCCLIHDRHKTPHSGCDSAPWAQLVKGRS